MSLGYTVGLMTYRLTPAEHGRRSAAEVELTDAEALEFARILLAEEGRP